MNENQKNFILSVIIKSLIIIIGISGVISTISIGKFMISYNAFLYYTIQSNVFIIIMTIICLCLDCLEHKNKKKYITNGLLLVKFSLTVAITITFLVFFVLLAPILSLDYLLSYSNFSVHLVVPLLAMLDYFLFDYKVNLQGKRYLVGLAMPFYYLIFALVLSVLAVDFNGTNVPYFFLNYNKIGWLFEKNNFGVIFWIIILGIFFTLLSYLFAFLTKKRCNKKG